MARPEIVGPEHVSAPFPVVVDTYITSGFGRGSSELGCPTANIEPGLLSELDPGVYYGWAAVWDATSEKTKAQALENKKQGLHVDSKDGTHRPPFNYGSELSNLGGQAFPMVMSIGWNPYYQNKQKSAEVHIVHTFPCSFYGARIKVAVVGYIRPEQSYDSLDALKQDIQTDIRVALRSLERPAYQQARELVNGRAR